jgi:hypothetical protein
MRGIRYLVVLLYSFVYGFCPVSCYEPGGVCLWRFCWIGLNELRS